MAFWQITGGLLCQPTWELSYFPIFRVTCNHNAELQDLLSLKLAQEHKATQMQAASGLKEHLKSRPWKFSMFSLHNSREKHFLNQKQFRGKAVWVLSRSWEQSLLNLCQRPTAAQTTCCLSPSPYSDWELCFSVSGFFGCRHSIRYFEASNRWPLPQWGLLAHRNWLGFADAL